MIDYPDTMRELTELASAVATSTPVIREAESKGVNQAKIREAVAALEDVGAVPDDGVPPVAPTGIVVTPGARQFIVNWDDPPAEEYVEQSRVTTSRVSTGASVRVQYIRSNGITVPELDAYQADGTTRESYTVKVEHIDRWGRLGASATTTAVQPLLSASDEVDLAKLAILGRLQGQLPNTNLATIEDAIKLGNGVVQARSMTSMDAAAMNLWVQNAAIESAKIKNITAEQIVAGTLKVAVSLDTGGKITIKGSGQLEVITGATTITQHVTLDTSGISLRGTTVFRDAANNDRQAKITPISGNPKAAISLIDSTVRNGVYMRGEGTVDKGATIALDVLNSTTSDPANMPGILMEAGTGFVNRISMNGPRIDIDANLFAVHSTTVNFDNGWDANKKCQITSGGLDVTGPLAVQGAVTSDGMNVHGGFNMGIVSTGMSYMMNSLLNGGGPRIFPTVWWTGNISGSTTSTLNNANVTALHNPALYYYNGAQYNWCDRSTSGQGQLFWVEETTGSIRFRNNNTAQAAMAIAVLGR